MSPRVFKQKGSKVYRGRYRLGDDPRIYDVPLNAKIKHVAEAKLRLLVREKEDELLGLLPPKKLREAAKESLEVLVAEFIASLKERKRCEDHVRHNQERLTALFTACRWRLLRDVNAEDFLKWRGRTAKLSPKTRNEYLGHAGAFFNWLVRNDRFTHNPLKSVSKLPTVGEETFRRRALTLEEFVHLIRGTGKRRLAYFLACCTGLRRGEIKQLLWSDIDLAATEPAIRLRPETTKNKKGGTIPLLPVLADLLRKKKSEGVHFSGLVLPYGVPSSKTLAKDLKACRIAVEDERGYRVDFHALRHTFVSLLAHAKVSELVRVKLARHSSWKQTDGYTDAKSVPLADGIALLAAVLPSSIASLNSGKPSPNPGNVVQINLPPESKKVVSISDERATLDTVVPDLEKENWRRGGDSNPRYAFTRITL